MTTILREHFELHRGDMARPLEGVIGPTRKGFVRDVRQHKVAFLPLLRDQAGSALLELLIAAAVGGALIGVLLRFTVAAQTSAAVQGEVADLQQRLRVAADRLQRDLLAAGAGSSRGAGQGPLNRVFSPILPARTGLAAADPELSFHDDRISIVYVRQTRAQTALTSDMDGPASPLPIDAAAPGCPAAAACGFARGDDVVIYEPGAAGGAHEMFTVAAVDVAAALLSPVAALSRAYPAGARVAPIIHRVYYLDRAGKRLMVYDGVRSDLPLVDHVVDLRFAYYGDPRADAVPPPAPGLASCAHAGLPPVPLLANLGGAAPARLTAAMLTDGPACGQAPNRFDADLLRIRRVAVTIRLEAEAEFRGVSGLSRTGTAPVLDLQTSLDVAPRNMAR